jgi:hypothetical protein
VKDQRCGCTCFLSQLSPINMGSHVECDKGSYNLFFSCTKRGFSPKHVVLQVRVYRETGITRSLSQLSPILTFTAVLNFTCLPRTKDENVDNLGYQCLYIKQN